jgi:hypothetical protein
LGAKTSALSRSSASIFAFTSGAFRACYLRFARGSRTTASCWRQALWDQAFQWGFVATLLAFAFTLSDPIGYAFGGATIAFLLLQRLVWRFWIRSHRSPSPSS